MNNCFLLTLLLFFSLNAHSQKNRLLIEAERFASKGGWVVYQQFMDQMDLPFLMAHAMGIPVKDTKHSAAVSRSGQIPDVRPYPQISNS